MDLPPDPYVDLMPCDPELLVEIGRVNWAGARLHADVRDAINRFDGAPSDAPFMTTLGRAVTELMGHAEKAGHRPTVDWTEVVARPAVKKRNAVVHAITFTAPDGRQAIMTADRSDPGRFLVPELREVTLHLVHASMTLPAHIS